MPSYNSSLREKWAARALLVGANQATAELGYPTTKNTVARWADQAGAEVHLGAEVFEDLDDDRLRSTLARLMGKINDRLAAELYVRTPAGVKRQPLAGTELAALAAAVERIVGTHRVLEGEAADVIEHRHELGHASARLLERSLVASRRRAAIFSRSHERPSP